MIDELTGNDYESLPARGEAGPQGMMPRAVTIKPQQPRTLDHPEHGKLTVGARTGRSRVCTKADGTEVTLSSKLINKLSKPAMGPIAPEDFVESVKLYLESMGDTPQRLHTAKDVWLLCDTYLNAPEISQ